MQRPDCLSWSGNQLIKWGWTSHVLSLHLNDFYSLPFQVLWLRNILGSVSGVGCKREDDSGLPLLSQKRFPAWHQVPALVKRGQGEGSKRHRERVFRPGATGEKVSRCHRTGTSGWTADQYPVERCAQPLQKRRKSCQLQHHGWTLRALC